MTHYCKVDVDDWNLRSKQKILDGFSKIRKNFSIRKEPFQTDMNLRLLKISLRGFEEEIVKRKIRKVITYLQYPGDWRGMCYHWAKLWSPHTKWTQLQEGRSPFKSSQKCLCFALESQTEPKNLFWRSQFLPSKLQGQLLFLAKLFCQEIPDQLRIMCLIS